jgi:hypothetical protein
MCGRDEMKSVHNILFRNTEGKRSLGRPMYIWEDTFRMDLSELGWEVMDWIHLA